MSFLSMTSFCLPAVVMDSSSMTTGSLMYSLTPLRAVSQGLPLWRAIS